MTFKIIGRFPERFINLSIKNGIGIFDAKPETQGLFASMIISDYKIIRPIAKRSGVRLKIIKRRGLPFILHRFRHRWGIGLGILLFLIISLVLQNFVWSIELNGVKTISETQLIDSLSESGFFVGKFKGNLDLHKIEREIQLEFSEIGWMSINLMGTHAEIEIKEKALVPQSEYSDSFNNIKASRDGIILSQNISRGTAETSVGSAVSEGQLLVSGMYENALGEVHFVDADAEVIASTSYEFTASCDEARISFMPQEKAKRSELNLLWFKVPLSFAPQSSPFSSYSETLTLFLYDTPVPVSLCNEYLCSYLQVETKISETTAKSILDTELALYKLFNLKNAISITDETEIIKTPTGYKLNAKLVCTEDIAVKENLIVNLE